MPDRINAPRRSTAFIVISLILVASSGAFGNPLADSPPHRSIELQDYYRFATASSPAISPDGRYVLYVKTSIDE